MNDWNIQSRAHACQGCEKSFVDKESYHTVLFDQHGALTRLDVCDRCWEGQFGHGAHDRKGFVSYWKGVYEAPPPAPPEAIKKENAEGLLRKLIELNEPRYAAASFILAVMLERKRLLKVKEQLFRDGGRVFIYEHPPTGDIFSIPDPNLQLNQLEQVQRDVGDLLEHGLPVPDQAAETPVAPEILPVAESGGPTDPGQAAPAEIVSSAN